MSAEGLEQSQAPAPPRGRPGLPVGLARARARVGRRDLTATALAATIAAFGLAVAASLDGSLQIQHDSGVYLSLAESLASGPGYRDLYLVGTPPEVKYPPVFPALLAPIIHAFGYSAIAAKAVVAAMAVAALCVLARLGRRLGPAPLPLLLVLFTAASHGIVFYATSVRTEIPYLLFSLLALLWLDRYLLGASRPAVAVAVLALLPLAYLTRLIGLSLLVAAIAYRALEPRARAQPLRRAFLVGTLAALPAAAWFLRAWWLRDAAALPYVAVPYEAEFRLAVPAAPAYAETVAALAAQALQNLERYVAHVGRVVFFHAPAVSGTALPAMLAAVTALGFAWRAIRERTVVEYYVFCYAAVLLVYPATHVQRYLVPLIPFVWYYFFIGARQLGSALRLPVAAARGVAAALLVIALAGNVTAVVLQDVLKTSAERYYGAAGERDYRAVVPWVVAETSPDAVFLWTMPSLRYVWSGRRAARIALPQSPDALLAAVRAHGPRYAVVDDLPGAAARSIRALVEAHPDGFRLVHRVPGSAVYEIVN